jgi:hypothetical protein
MKLSTLAGIVLGVALVLTSMAMLANFGVIAPPLSPKERAIKELEAVGGGRIADIEETTTLELPESAVDFGLQEEGVSVEREFSFKNVGQKPLHIMGIRPSCSCIFVKEKEMHVEPGETGTLTVGINTKDLAGPVEKFLLLKTNDPEHRELSITLNAVVTFPVEVISDGMVFSRLLANDSASKDAKVYSRLDQPFEILGVRLSKPEIAQFFDITYRPLEPSELPPEGKTGWLVTVAVKPGLPTGGFNQIVTLETSVEKMKEVTFPVDGNVVNDISVVALGVEFNAKHNLVSLGAVKQAIGDKVKMKLFVAGEYRDKLELGTPVCDPDFLKVTIGERKSINNGAASEFPFEIEIPPDSPVISLLGTEQAGVGHVTIPTNHSSMKEVKILLHFAVEK